MELPKIKTKVKSDAETQAWKEGFEAGVRTQEAQNEKALQIGRAVMDVMWNTFQPKKENF